MCYNQDISKQSITPKKPLPSASVTRTDNKVFINIIDENVFLHESVHVSVTHSAQVEEKEILEVFHKLQRFNIFQINENSSLRQNNLKKSLENYSNAIEENSMVLKFRDLFTALELCVNVDGTESTGVDFDNKVSNRCGAKPGTVGDWRAFYNGVKHVDRNQRDIDSRYKYAQQDFPQQLTALRNHVRRILFSELK
jgi:hypothetical protein